MSLVYNQVQIYTLLLNGTNKIRKNCLSSESQRLLLLGEVEVFGHFIEEGAFSTEGVKKTLLLVMYFWILLK